MTLTPNLKDVADSAAHLLTNFFDIPLNAAKGITWLTVKEWQLQSHSVLTDVTKMTREEREKAIKEMFDIYRDRLKRILVNPEEQKALIDEAMDKAWDIYIAYEKKGIGKI